MLRRSAPLKQLARVSSKERKTPKLNGRFTGRRSVRTEGGGGFSLFHRAGRELRAFLAVYEVTSFADSL